MWPLLKSFMFDETAAIRFIRGGVAFLALIVDKLVGLPPWVSPVIVGLALTLGAGEKNPTPPAPPAS